VSHLLVPFCARKPSNRRKRAAVGTAHDKLQVAEAYLGHGRFLPAHSNPPFRAGLRCIAGDWARNSTAESGPPFTDI
jgi:hypothetical protein